MDRTSTQSTAMAEGEPSEANMAEAAVEPTIVPVEAPPQPVVAPIMTPMIAMTNHDAANADTESRGTSDSGEMLSTSQEGSVEGEDENAAKARRLNNEHRLLKCRERNRVHARNTRERKKHQMDDYQSKIQMLLNEQAMLSNLVQDNTVAGILMSMSGSGLSGGPVLPLDQSPLQQDAQLQATMLELKEKIDRETKLLDDMEEGEVMKKDRSECTAEELINIRKERNRIHARKTRLRKKQALKESELALSTLESGVRKLRRQAAMASGALNANLVSGLGSGALMIPGMRQAARPYSRPYAASQTNAGLIAAAQQQHQRQQAMNMSSNPLHQRCPMSSPVGYMYPNQQMAPMNNSRYPTLTADTLAAANAQYQQAAVAAQFGNILKQNAGMNGGYQMPVQLQHMAQNNSDMGAWNPYFPKNMMMNSSQYNQYPGRLNESSGNQSSYYGLPNNMNDLPRKQPSVSTTPGNLANITHQEAAPRADAQAQEEHNTDKSSASVASETPSDTSNGEKNSESIKTEIDSFATQENPSVLDDAAIVIKRDPDILLSGSVPNDQMKMAAKAYSYPSIPHLVSPQQSTHSQQQQQLQQQPGASSYYYNNRDMAMGNQYYGAQRYPFQSGGDYHQMINGGMMMPQHAAQNSNMQGNYYPQQYFPMQGMRGGNPSYPPMRSPYGFMPGGSSGQEGGM